MNKKALDQYTNFTEQREELARRQTENGRAEDKIKQLIQTLDMRKDEAVERTFKVSVQSKGTSGRYVVSVDKDGSTCSNFRDHSSREHAVQDLCKKVCWECSLDRLAQCTTAADRR